MPTKTPLTTKKFRKKRKLYDLVDENDKFVQRGTREDAKKLGLWWRVVHIFVFNTQRELLICKRPPWSTSYPSLITSSAGGKVEAGETYLAAARRELLEELDITPPLQSIGRYNVRTKKHGNVIHWLFITHANRVHPSRREVASAQFTPLNKIVRDTHLHPKRYALPFLKALGLFKKRRGKNFRKIKDPA